MGLKDLEIKSLLSKLAATEDELMMIDAINDECLSDFLTQVDSFASECNLKRNIPINENNGDSKLTEKEIDNSIKIPEDIKKVYRKIVIMTHPDKNLDQSEEERLRLSKIFDRAVKAFDETDIIELLKLCKELGIEGFEIGHNHLDLIKERVKQLNSELELVKKSSIYTWYNLDDDQRKTFIEDLVKSNYIPKT